MTQLPSLISGERRLRIAVIGAGVAGLTAAYLLQKKHDVTLFEKNDYLGGHTNTIEVEDARLGKLPVDTGFIVTNNQTYPLFQKLLRDLGVSLRDSDMSFGFHCERSGLQYSSTSLANMFAQRKNLVRPTFLKMIFDILQFNRRAARDLQRSALNQRTLGRYLEDLRLGHSFRNDYLVPMAAAIWSTSHDEMLEFPAEAFLRFFANHGLLSVSDQPQWQTVVGGSFAYVKEIRKRLPGSVLLKSEVQSIERNESSVQCRSAQASFLFDKVVIAAHADESLRMLANPSQEENRLLGAWRYSKNRTLLHTDASVLPPNTRAWASWNYRREPTASRKSAVSVTYHMNRLQGIRSDTQYCVTLNTTREIAPRLVLRELSYMHPLYTFDSMATQAQLPELNGKRNTYYCGSYFGYGFHEDAVRSAVQVAKCFGIAL